MVCSPSSFSQPTQIHPKTSVDDTHAPGKYQIPGSFPGTWVVDIKKKKSPASLSPVKTGEISNHNIQSIIIKKKSGRRDLGFAVLNRAVRQGSPR